MQNRKKRLFYGQELPEAAKNADVKKVEKLISKGINVNAHGKCSSQTALRNASYESHKDIVKILLKNGADPRIPQGDSPLVAIIGLHHPKRNPEEFKIVKEIVEMLLKAGANPNEQLTHFYNIPLIQQIKILVHAYTDEQRKELVDLLKKYGAKE